MNEPYTTVNVNIKLANGDQYTTGFNISDRILVGKTPQEVVTKYFVGRKYTYASEEQSEIVSAEVLN